MSEPTGSPTEVIRSTIESQLERIRTALDDRNLSKVAAATGLHENTVRNIAKRKGGTPTIATIDKLATYLFG
jgi:transcriptional regulator with XRE-family HTH domain